MSLRKPTCCVLIILLVPVGLFATGFRISLENAPAQSTGYTAVSPAIVSSALASLENGAAENVSPAAVLGNLGTFFDYYLSNDPGLNKEAADVIGPNTKKLSDQVAAAPGSLDYLYSNIGAGDTAYTLSSRGGDFYEEKVGQYYSSDLLEAFGAPRSPAGTWAELEPDIALLVPPDQSDTQRINQDVEHVQLDQYIGYSKGLILPESGYGLLEQAFRDVLTSLWSSTGGSMADFSTSYESSIPVVAERAMYTSGQLRGATCMRPSMPSKSHYFAEGYASSVPGQTAESYVLLQNGEDRTANAKLTFYRTSGDPITDTVQVPPHTRYTVSGSKYLTGEFSISVESDVPVGAERSVYIQGRLYGSTCEHGAELSSFRFFTEGYVAPEFETYFTLFNPNSGAVEAEFTFMGSDGSVRTCSETVPPRSRRTLNAGDRVTGEFSTMVRSSGDIAVERVLYATGNPGELIGATCEQGLTVLSRERHFAEGYTMPGEFETFFALGNPGPSPANVGITFFTPDGTEKYCMLMIPPLSRKTVRASEYVTGEFSTRVESDTDVAAERVVYANGESDMGFMGATVDQGVEKPSRAGNFPEGSQRSEIGATTYLTISNPDRNEAARVDITCATGAGNARNHSVTVPPQTRCTVDLGDRNHDQLLQDCYGYVETLFLREMAQQLMAALMYVDVTRIYYKNVIGDEGKGIAAASQWLADYRENFIKPQVEEFKAIVERLACSQINLDEAPGVPGITSWDVIQGFMGRADFIANQLLNPCDYFNPEYGNPQWEAARQAQCAVTYTWITDRGVVPESAKLTLSTRSHKGSSTTDWQQVLATPDCVNPYSGPGGETAVFTNGLIQQHTTDLSGGRIATQWFDKWYWRASNDRAVHTVTPDTNLLLVRFRIPRVDLSDTGQVDFKIDVSGTTFGPSGNYTNESGTASGENCKPKNADYGDFTGKETGNPGTQGPLWYASSALYQRSGGMQAFDQSQLSSDRVIDGKTYHSGSVWSPSVTRSGDSWGTDSGNTKQEVDFSSDDWSQDVWCAKMGWPHKAHTYETTGYLSASFMISLPDYDQYDIPPPGEAVVQYYGNFMGFDSSHANPQCWFSCNYGSSHVSGYIFNKHEGDIRHFDGTQPVPGKITGWFPEVPLNESVAVTTTNAVNAYDHTKLEGRGWDSGKKAEFDFQGARIDFQGYGRPDAWMGDIAGVIGPHRLNEICIPGTHDSGTSPINAGSHVNGETGVDWRELAEKITTVVWAAEAAGLFASLAWGGGFILAVVVGVVAGELTYDIYSRNGLPQVQANWSKAQPGTIGEQLNDGIRYVDLRVVRENDGTYVLSHSMTGEKLADVLNDVVNFSKSQTKEFILLDFNHVYNEGKTDASGFDHGALIKYVKDRIGSNLIPRTGDPNALVLNTLWKSSPRIVMFYCDKGTVDANSDLWHHCASGSFNVSDYQTADNPSQMINPWANTDSADYLKTEWTNFATGQKAALEAARAKGAFFTLQAQLTDQQDNNPPQSNRSVITGSLAWLARHHTGQFITGAILKAVTKAIAGKDMDDVPISLEEMAEESNPAFFDALLKDSTLQQFVKDDLNVIIADFATDPLLPTGVPGDNQSLYEFATDVNMDRYGPGGK